MKTLNIPIDKIQNFSAPEIHLFALGILILCFLFYKLFLKKISEKRHKSLLTRFKITLKYLLTSVFLSIVLNYLIYPKPELNVTQSEPHILVGYLFFALLILMSIAIVKVTQIVVYLYLFFANMSHGVPRLLANMFTFFITIILINIIATNLFEVHLSALLATSAVFSLVLGLALQDTLGNLFSGISLQIESPFHIGDWIEVHSKNEKWLGQVQEMNWRATFLMSFSDELIMIPNKTIAQSEIVIVSQGNKTIRISHMFRFPFDVSTDLAKKAIFDGIAEVKNGILSDPPVRILITDLNESWVVMKVFYSLSDFSVRYRMGDQIISSILGSLKKNNIRLQSQKIEIIQS